MTERAAKMLLCHISACMYCQYAILAILTYEVYRPHDNIIILGKTYVIWCMMHLILCLEVGYLVHLGVCSYVNDAIMVAPRHFIYT